MSNPTFEWCTCGLAANAITDQHKRFNPVSVKMNLKCASPFLSQVHNFQKLKNISLKAVNFLATKTKVTCLSETVFFPSSYSGVTAIFTVMWVILPERPFT